MLKFTDPYTSQLLECPACGLCAFTSRESIQVVLFKEDAPTNHLLWTCPGEDCAAWDLSAASEKTLCDYTEAEYPVYVARRAPAWLRLLIRACQRRDSSYEPLRPTSRETESFRRSCEELQGLAEFMYRCA